MRRAPDRSRINHRLRVIDHVLRGGFGLGLFLLLAACSLAEDITPPPGIELTQTAAAPAPVIPTTRPDSIAGADIFAQHCSKCHGLTGKGDGELLAQLTGHPPDFTDPATLRVRAPHEIFTIVTQGRLEKTMPPFGNALTDEQRWNVVAYLYTLARPPSETTAALFATQCAECHVTGTAADLSALAFFATQTEQHLFEVITAGLADGSHRFTTLSADERWALAQHVQTLAFAPSSIAQPDPTPTPSAAPGVSDGVGVGGLITNGTANSIVPDDLPVEVFVFDSASLVGTYTTTVRNSRYSITGLAPEVEQSIAASTQYLGVTYVSDIVRATEGQIQYDLPLKIFETTTDSAMIRIARWHVVLAAPQDNTIQVAELLSVSNDSDRVLVAPGEGLSTVEIPLPEGASNLQFEQSGGLYQPTAAGFGYTGSILPGAETLQMIFAFDLPVIRQTEFVQTVRYPVEAVNVLVPQTGLRLTASALSGPQTTDVQGTPYLSYAGTALLANETLTLTLTSAGAPLGWMGWVSAGVILVVISGLGFWWSIKRQGARRGERVNRSQVIDPIQRRAMLIDSLARLDDDFANGQMAEPAYQRRRAKLKAEALALTQPPDD